MNCTHEAVTGNYLYSGRVLGTTEPEDLIQLHSDLKSQWQTITEHYHRIGLPHSQNVIWDVSFDLLAKYPDYETSVFIFGDTLEKGSKADQWFRKADPDWHSVVELINSKNNFVELAEKLGVKVPKTLCFANQTEIKKATQLPYPCYLKPAVSVDGIGISCCENEEELKEALANLEEQTPLQVQQEIKADSFLNLQYRATAGKIERVAATEQVLDGYSHSGNRYPSEHQPWEMVEPMAQWMSDRGMKEIFAFDVAVVEAQTDSEYFAIECNPRYNGASYPTGIARKLNIDSWVSETFSTEKRSLDEIDLGGIEYDSQSGTGVIIVNWGTILIGKIAVLIAGSLDTQKSLRTELKNRL